MILIQEPGNPIRPHVSIFAFEKKKPQTKFIGRKKKTKTLFIPFFICVCVVFLGGKLDGGGALIFGAGAGAGAGLGSLLLPSRLFVTGGRFGPLCLGLILPRGGGGIFHVKLGILRGDDN